MPGEFCKSRIYSGSSTSIVIVIFGCCLCCCAGWRRDYCSSIWSVEVVARLDADNNNNNNQRVQGKKERHH